MKLVTFNIRCDFGQDGENNFCFRKPLILEKLRRERPDLICFQEVLPHVAAWLKEELTDCYVIGCGRSETLEDEQLAVAYRKDRLNLIQMETFWPRTATEALFEDLSGRTVFRLVNTHLDHEFPEARAQGLVQILQKLAQEALFPNAPAVITGDLNAEPGSPEMSALRTSPYRNVTAGTGVTYHGYGRGDPPCAIDYILTRGFDCERVEKWTDCRDGVYLSDHYPVCAHIRPAKP